MKIKTLHDWYRCDETHVVSGARQTACGGALQASDGLGTNDKACIACSHVACWLGLWATWEPGRQAGSCSLDMPADIEASNGPSCRISSPATFSVIARVWHPAGALQGAACLLDRSTQRLAQDLQCLHHEIRQPPLYTDETYFMCLPTGISRRMLHNARTSASWLRESMCRGRSRGQDRTCQNTTKISTNPIMVHARPSTVILRSIGTPSSASICQVATLPFLG